MIADFFRRYAASPNSFLSLVVFKPPGLVLVGTPLAISNGPDLPPGVNLDRLPGVGQRDHVQQGVPDGQVNIGDQPLL